VGERVVDSCSVEQSLPYFLRKDCSQSTQPGLFLRRNQPLLPVEEALLCSKTWNAREQGARGDGLFKCSEDWKPRFKSALPPDTIPLDAVGFAIPCQRPLYTQATGPRKRVCLVLDPRAQEVRMAGSLTDAAVTRRWEVCKMQPRVPYMEPILEITETLSESAPGESDQPRSPTEDYHSAKYALLQTGTEGENSVADSTKDNLACVNVLGLVTVTVNQGENSVQDNL